MGERTHVSPSSSLPSSKKFWDLLRERVLKGFSMGLGEWPRWLQMESFGGSLNWVFCCAIGGEEIGLVWSWVFFVLRKRRLVWSWVFCISSSSSYSSSAAENHGNSKGGSWCLWFWRCQKNKKKGVGLEIKLVKSRQSNPSDASEAEIR